MYRFGENKDLCYGYLLILKGYATVTTDIGVESKHL